MMSEIKPVLRQMIDNNKPHWRPATIRGAHKQLDEYEAKAKAFDRIKAYSDKAINGEIHHPIVLAEGVIDVVEQYYINRLSESGERNER